MEPQALKLVMLKGPREGETLEYRPGFKIRLGRIVRGNNLPIKDPGISTNHLTIDSDDSGKWVLQDLDSSNGTIVNDTKLTPLTPFYLNDGDEIKIGELTSISVTIVCHEESRLRRNPKRGPTATKAEKTIAESRGRRGRDAKETELKVEKKEEQIGGAAAPVVRNEVNSELEKEAEKIDVAKKRPRGRPKRSRVLKSEEPVEEVTNEEERISGGASKAAEVPVAQNEVNSELEKEAEMIEVAKKPPRAQPKRCRVFKSEEPVEEVAVLQRVTTRRSKNAASVSALAEVMENCSLEFEEVKKVEPKMRRGGGRRKKNVADELPVSDKVDVLEQNDLVEMVEVDAKDDGGDDDKVDVLKQKHLGEMVKVDAKGDGGDDKIGVLEHEGLGEIDAVDPKDDGCGGDDKVEVPEHEGLGKIDAIDPKNDDGDEEEGNYEAVIDADVGGSVEMDESGNMCCSGARATKDVDGNESVKGWSAKVGLELDLEAMTLKDWFEYVEYSWPKVVNDEIDKICMEMREKAKRVQEYIAQNKKEKGHG